MALTEYWEKNGELTIFIGAVVLGAVLLTRLSRLILGRYLDRSSTTMKTDPTNFRFLRNSISVVIYIIAGILIVYRLPGGETLAVSLFASAGIIAAIVGFASQAAFSNIISGIFIVLFKPFRVQDFIRIGTDINGVVEDITLRHTVIRDFENRRIIMPNSVISEQTVINSSLTDERICRHVEFTISYDSNVELARQIIREVAEAHPKCLDNRTEEDIAAGQPKVRCPMVAFDDSAVRLRAYIWGEDSPSSFETYVSVIEEVKKRFEQEGVEIPFPHRTIVFKKNTRPEDIATLVGQ